MELGKPAKELLADCDDEVSEKYGATAGFAAHNSVPHVAVANLSSGEVGDIQRFRAVRNYESQIDRGSCLQFDFE